MANVGVVGKRGEELVRTVSFSCKPKLFRKMSAYVEERGGGAGGF